AVPAEDLDASGVPDFVERAGAWAETSRTTFRNAGFTSPVGRDGLVDVEFRAMNAYGLTRIVGGFPVISLHHDFLGFPDNSDPEGSDRGAAKVTIAHEIKHASQYAASGWTEGGWLEADATWAEDFVFDQVDDYVRYVAERSPVSDPDAWLPASYGACVWQHLLEQRHGVELLKEFFDRRSAVRQEDARESFEFALNAYGSDVATEARELGLWSYFCGANSGGKPLGFDEAAAWPTPPYVAHVVEPSATRSGRLGGLESHYLLIQAGDRIGSPVLALTGAGAARCSMSALLLRTSGVREVIPVPVDGTGAALELPCEWSDLAMLAVVITNRDAFSPETEWFVTIDVDGAVDVLDPEGAVPFALAAPRPNPFRGSTALAFSLPRESDVRLAVFDVSGRLVRRLIDGERLPAGPHERRWDGTDEVGRTAAPGVYYYRLQSGEYSDSRRMLLLR
ncbi:MAG: hypothetical protein KC591_17695, partial [Gemmatimonadetes bacterium]|nr:hypothetical protein [Gemmatimonadota bacterium]